MKKMAYANFFTSAITYRFTASPYIGSKQWDSGDPLIKIWDIIEIRLHWASLVWVWLYLIISKEVRMVLVLSLRCIKVNLDTNF